MYEYITGKIITIKPTYLVLENGGIGYLLNVANPYAFSNQLGAEATIYLHQVIREDAHSLYGFVDEAEKEVFLKLIGVTGIGPKSALAIIARADNDGLVAAIDSGDITYLTKFPGVGKKTASQMVLDLAGKFDALAVSATQSLSGNNELTEAMEALLALGYKANELKKLEKQLEAGERQSAESYIKKALRLLVK